MHLEGGGVQRRHQGLVEVADIEFLSLESLPYLGFYFHGNSDTGDGTADRERTRVADADKAVAEGMHRLRGGGDNLDLMTHPGKLSFQA